jgi:hypothetical protein
MKDLLFSFKSIVFLILGLSLLAGCDVPHGLGGPADGPNRMKKIPPSTDSVPHDLLRQASSKPHYGELPLSIPEPY